MDDGDLVGLLGREDVVRFIQVRDELDFALGARSEGHVLRSPRIRSANPVA